MFINLSARCCGTLLALSMAASACAADGAGAIVAAQVPHASTPVAQSALPHAATNTTKPQEIEVRGASQRESVWLDSDPFGVASSMHPIGFACHVDPSESNADGPDPFYGHRHAMLTVKLDASEPIEAPMAWWR